MTCIVGYVSNGKVYMGGDSMGVNTSTYEYRIVNDSKVFTRYGFIFGFTGSFRMGQLLRYKFNLGSADIGMDDTMEFMCTKFIDHVRQLFKDNGYSRIVNNVERGGDYLVGVNGRLFIVEEDYQIGENRMPYMSVGCGYQYAMGAMHALHDNKKLNAGQKISKALDAACANSAYVKEPYNIIHI